MKVKLCLILKRKRPNPSEYLDVESKIELNKVVSNLQWNQDRVLVTCTDGSRYSAEFVIFTPSLGVLKANHESLFTPRLPDWKVHAIEHMGWGTLEKFYLEFATPFWPENNPNWVMYKILWTFEDEEAVRGTPMEWFD